MATDSDKSLLAILTHKKNGAPPADAPSGDDRLQQLLSRINQQLSTSPSDGQAAAGAAGGRITPSGSANKPEATGAAPAVDPHTGQLAEFIPQEPNSIQAAGLTDSEVEALILKYLLARGDATGRDIA